MRRRTKRTKTEKGEDGQRGASHSASSSHRDLLQMVRSIRHVLMRVQQNHGKSVDGSHFSKAYPSRSVCNNRSLSDGHLISHRSDFSNRDDASGGGESFAKTNSRSELLFFFFQRRGSPLSLDCTGQPPFCDYGRT